MIVITSDLVSEFWKFMLTKFGTTVGNKSDAVEMQIVATLLGSLGITDKEKFLNNFTTTIGKKIYTPFEIGIESSNWNLWSQIVICVHEHQHVIQYNEKGTIYEIEYLTSRNSRALFEVEAYRSNLEMNYWRYGKSKSARETAELLRNYGCDNDEIELAFKSLSLINSSVRQNIVVNESSKVAIDWLNSRAT